jgi:hypothetical protein
MSVESQLADTLGHAGYYILGIAFFVLMGIMLYRAGMKKTVLIDDKETRVI